MKVYSVDEQYRLSLYGTCPVFGCGAALDTRLVKVAQGQYRVERFCPDCQVIQ